MAKQRRALNTNAPKAVLLVAPFNPTIASLADKIVQLHRTVVWRSTCQDAIQCASNFPIEVVLTAPSLPDGEWTTILRSLQVHRDPPPVILIRQDKS